jgi:hypothetical protein
VAAVEVNLVLLNLEMVLVFPLVAAVLTALLVVLVSMALVAAVVLDGGSVVDAVALVAMVVFTFHI